MAVVVAPRLRDLRIAELRWRLGRIERRQQLLLTFLLLEEEQRAEHQRHFHNSYYSNQTDAYKDLSSHLYRVLDVVGVSEEVREGDREWATVQEILHTAVNKVTRDGVVSAYIFGSQYEGTTTPGLQSDMDILVCDDRVPVVENIDDAPVDGPALLMLSDDTKPGYVKLQSVVNRTKQTTNETEETHGEDTDHQGRILVKHVHSSLPNAKRHGPADNIPAGEGTVERDIVQAYRCRTIPSFADEWLHRHRPYQWPSQEQLQRMGSYGSFLVGISHPKSDQKETEWRISFSLQERDIMSSLNPTQHKCYVLLKMIKKDIIQPRVGKSLSSYHCKTCIFHLAESRGIEQWTPNNLVSCIFECLRLLLVWIRQGKCPNYFIKEENMFDKLERSTFKRLYLVLQELLSNGVHFLYDINCDDLGMLLTMPGSDRRLEEKKLEVKKQFGYHLYINTMRIFLCVRNEYHRFIDYAHTPSERVSLANYFLQYLERTEIITEHKPINIRMVLDTLIPYIHTVIFQMKCSNNFDQIKRENETEVIQSLAREIQLCNHCDLISSRLLVASLYLQCDKLDSCQEILQDCEASLKPYVISMCCCHKYKKYMHCQLSAKIVAESLSFEDFRRECTAACMIFLPSEANLVPAALRYDMYRSVYTPPGSRDEYFDRWFDWILVDSKVYLYYMQYILYDKTNKPVYKHEAIDNLQHLINNKYEDLGHRETALNLLGWIYMQENKVQNAIVCFRRSLAIRPLHNAAKWHMAILLHSLITPQTIYKRKRSSPCDDDTGLSADKRRKM